MNLVRVFAAFFAIGTTSVPAASAQAQGQGLRSRALQTPDGTPPALEGVCDTYKDLEEPYGICVALCEAQDCGSTTSCEALKTNWLELTGEELPCELTTTTTSTGTPGTTTTGTDAPGETCSYSCCTNTGCLDLPQTGCNGGCGRGTEAACYEAAEAACWSAGGSARILRNNERFGSLQGNKSCQELAESRGEPDGKAACKAATLPNTGCWFEFCSVVDVTKSCALTYCAAGCDDQDCKDAGESLAANIPTGGELVFFKPSDKFSCVITGAKDVDCPATTTTAP